MANGEVATVAGCAGGRLRLMTGQVFTASTPASQSLGAISSYGFDLGLGAAALQAKLLNTESGDVIRIWFGTSYSPPPEPAQYSTVAAGAMGSLDYSEVAAGAVHRVDWHVPTASWTQPISMPLIPTGPTGGAPRGGGPVGGLLLADINSSHPGDELVAACMTGDVIVLDPLTLAVIGRTHFGGVIGHYNSLVVADFGDGEAIYIAGSLGLRRITP